MKSFSHWKKIHDANNLTEFNSAVEGQLWLKIKAILRKELIEKYAEFAHIDLQNKGLEGQFEELFKMSIADPEASHKTLDRFIAAVKKENLRHFNTTRLISELYKLKTFEWGGDYKNSLDKYLVSQYVKKIDTYRILLSMLDKKINEEVKKYVLNSWYNHWTSILIEHLFTAEPGVLPAIGKIKNVDFFIKNIPFDLKVTYLPGTYIKEKRKQMNLPSELTFLKQKAKEEGIIFDKTADESTISYEIAEKMKDKDTPGCKKSLKILEKERLRILNDAMHNPKDLSRWLYENQGEMRFGSENRIFVVLVDTKKFEDSWKLKRNLNILKPEISAYVKRLKKSNIQSMRVDFAYKGKPGIYSALTDVLFVLKK